MKLQDSIKRIRYTLSKQNKPNTTDVEAFNSILQELDFLQISKVENNRPFAKLLILYLKDKYEINNDINTALYFLAKELGKDLELHIDKLSNRILTTQVFNFINSLKIDVTEIEMQNIELLDLKENEFWDIHKQNILDEIKLLNSKENIRNDFYKTANEILNTEIYRK